jgi:hypothetical protein
MLLPLQLLQACFQVFHIQPNCSLWFPTQQVCVPYAVELQLLLTVLPLRLLQACYKMLHIQPSRSLWDPTLQVCVPHSVELKR